MKKCFFLLVLLLIFPPGYLKAQRLLVDYNTTKIGEFNTDGLSYDIALLNNRAYIADYDRGLRILNVSNPASPTELGYYLPVVQSLALSVAVTGNYAYLTTNSQGLRIINISSPYPNMIEMGGIAFSGECNGVAVSGNYAYVTNNVAGLQVVNISNPSNPFLVTTVPIANYANNVAVSGNYAYVTTDDQGLKVINITNPASPSIVGSLSLPGHSYGISISGNYAYIANYDYGLRIVNIQNPLNPQLVATFNTNGYAYDVTVSENFAYVADYDFGLRIINISVPASPVEAGAYNTNGLAYGVAFSGTNAYVADYDFGLVIIRNDLLNLTVTAPNGGEIWQAGTSKAITWTSTGVANVKIEYSTDNGTNWTQIVATTPASTGTYSWTVPNTTSDKCLVRISDVSNPSRADISNGAFTICALNLIAPAGGEKYQTGSPQEIKWSSAFITNIKIECSSNNGTNWTTLSSSTPANAGSYQWNIPSVTSNQYLVRISDASNATIQKTSTTFTVASVQVTVPNGGENWTAGTSQNITWTSSQISNVKLDYSTNGGINWINIIPNVAASPATYSWTVPNTLSTQCRVKVSDVTNSKICDSSNNNFTISAPAKSITVTSPNGGETWIISGSYNITWTSQNISQVKIEYSTNSGAGWTQIATNVQANTGSYQWTIPNTPSTQSLVKITEINTGSTSDVSNNVFNIASQAQPTLVLNSPNGGESWVIGSQQNILWTSTNISNVKLEYSTNNGSSWATIISSVSAVSGSYQWTIPDAPSNQCLVKISNAATGTPYDQSNAVFTITQGVQNLTLTAPNGGETWAVGSSQNITWTQTNISSLNIYYSTNNGSSWITIRDNVNASLGAISWTVPNTPSTQCKVKIQDATDGTPSDMSNATFTIPSTGKSITLLTPADGDDWYVGSVQNITWSSTNVTSVIIQYSTNAGETWINIGGVIPATPASYPWTVPNTQSDYCRMRISDAGNPEIKDVNGFSIYSERLRTTLLGQINTPGFARNVYVWSRYAFIADMSAGLRIIDISDPTNPTAVGYYDTPGSAYDVVVKNNYAYVADSLSGLLVINVSNPASPQLTAQLDTPGEAIGLEFNPDRDSILFLADGSAGIKIISINNPSDPKLLGSLNTPGTAYKTKYLGGSLHVADANGGLRIINVINYFSPNEVGSWVSNLVGFGIDIYKGLNNKFYTSVAGKMHNSNAIAIFDVANPTSPQWQTTFTLPDKPFDITQDDSYLYVAADSAGLRIVRQYSGGLDDMLAIGHYDTQGQTKGLDKKGRYVYLADGTEGLAIVRLDMYLAEYVILSNPNGGQSLRVGSVYQITWGSGNMNNGTYRLEYSTNNGTTWIQIAENISQTSYNWTVPNSPSLQCLVRVSNVVNINTNDQSNSTFRIYQPTLTLTSPNGGESWQAGTNANITWISADIDKLKLEYTTNNGTTWIKIDSNVTASTGTYTWTIPDVSSSQCKVRVSEYLSGNISDESNNVFTIIPPPAQILLLYSPNGSELLQAGSTHNITWASANIDSIKIEYSTNGGTSWITVISGTPAAGRSYTWTVPHTYSLNCKVRISDTKDGTPSAISAGVFIISQPFPTITVTEPTPGTNWKVSTGHWIRWTYTGTITKVSIDYSTNSGTTWLPVAVNIDASLLRYGWQVPVTPSTQCKIRVYETVNPATVGYSDSLFTISGPLSWNTTLLGTYDTPGAAFGIFVRGIYAYVGDASGGMRIINISDPTNPVEIGFYPLWATNRGIVLDSNYAYLSSYDLGLRILNVNNPETPVEVGFYNTPGQALKTAVSGNYAYVADGYEGLRIINIQNPALPAEVGFYKPSDPVVAVEISGNYAYLANYDGGLKVVNISNPAAPSLVASLTNIGQTRDLEISGNLLYIASYDSGLVVVNISNPLSPVITKIVNIEEGAGGINVSKNYINVTAFDYGLRIFNKTTYDEVAFYNTPNSAQDVYSVNNLCYVADYQSGLHIIRNDLAQAGSITLTAPLGGESWTTGSSRNITWTSANVENIKIEYTTNNGTSWITVAASVPSFPETFQWTVPNTPSANCRIRLSDVINATVKSISPNTFTISTQPLCVNFNVSMGWNIVSVPLTALNMKADSLFKDKTSAVYEYDNGYINADTLKVSKGYWLKYSQNKTVTVCGTRAPSNSVSVKQGWNIIGPFDVDISTAQITTNPPGILASPFYGYTNTYITADTLKYGKGYWIKSSQNGTLTLGTLLAKSSVNNLMFSSKEKIIITDAEGNFRELYFNSKPDEINMSELPPPPPQGIFDCRFADDKYTGYVSSLNTIIINSAQYPVQITAEGTAFEIKDIITGKIINTIINQGESALITNKNITAVSVKQVAVPEKFYLCQNYPNPFNPITTIRYDLPLAESEDASLVTLKIYDILGNEVATLINEKKKPGSYKQEWNASGYSSGIYFYELRYGNIRDIKKMVLIK